MEDLVRQVLAQEIGAADAAAAAGEAAVPALLPLARHDDSGVRRLALICLQEIGGAPCAEAFLGALDDPHLQVRSAAIQGLWSRPQDAAPESLLRAYDRKPDSLVRHYLPLILARCGKPAPIEDLRRRWKEEADPQAREGWIVALASLGVPEAREAFVRALHASADEDRRRLLGYAETFAGPWLLKPLRPLLGDETPLLRIGVDGRDDGPDALRACDLAVNLAAALSRRAFSFPADEAANFTAAQLEEVGRYLDGL